MCERLFIGIDGGGTRSRAVAMNESGEIRAEAAGGGMNFYASSMSSARAVLASLLEQLSQELKEPFHSLHIASAALDDRADAKLTRELTCGLAGNLKVVLVSDILAALYGLTLGDPGVMIVSGTGMMGAATTGSPELILRGGWGFALGDEGSCFAIGRDGIMAAVRADDRQGPPTELGQRVLDFFKVRRLRDIIPVIYDQGNSQQIIASFASEVISSARGGDAAAAAIVSSAVDALLAACCSLLESVSEDGRAVRVGVYGGFFHNPDLRECFRERLSAKHPAARVVDPKIPPEAGAILFGLRELNVEGWPAITACFRQRFSQGDDLL